MATINLASYKVVSQELSSSVKFNNLVQAIQDGLSLGTTDLGVAIITFGAAADTNLYRSAANYLKTDDNFQTALAIESYVGNAGQITLAAPGSVPTIYFGSAVDTNLYRSAADILQSDDTIRSTRAAVANTAFSAKTDADGSSRLRIEAGGKMEWGDGTTVDTNLYRSAADVLHTDDTFRVGGIFYIYNTGVLDIGEVADQANAPANFARLFAKDNGSGKTQLVVRFPSGATQVISTEP